MPAKAPVRILFFGDVFGKPGRKALQNIMQELKKEFNPDFVVVNVENIAHGKGVTVQTISAIDHLGIDAYTSGNHVFDKAEMSNEAFRKYGNLIRPANYIGDFAGRGFVRIPKNGQGYLIINLNGQVFFEKQFQGQISSAFIEFDKIIAEQARPGDVVIVDFHSEATSEKRAFGFYADGRASLVCGTHTHVPTADWQILPRGTGYVSDVGMIGALYSVIGVPIERSMEIFLNGKFSFDVAENNPIMVNAIYVEVADGKAVKIAKVYREVSV